MRLPELLQPRRVPLGTRTLLRDWLRLMISVGGIGLAILLVLLLDGIREGTVAKSTTYIDHVGADVFVARQGVTNMALAASVVPQEAIAEIQAVPGVRDATGIMRIPVILSADGDKRPATMIGYDSSASFGGPWLLTSGRAVQDETEAVIDDTLAGELGLDLGDNVEIGGAPFTVVGLSGETANIAGKHVFIARESAQRLLGFGERVGFVLVRVEPGSDAGAVAAAINAQVPEVTATPRDELSDNDRDLLSSLFVAPINVMFTVGLLVGLAVIGLTMYTTTAERIRDFGVLKAIGARNAFLFRTVMTQGLILAVAGFLAGLGAAKIAGPVLVTLVPDIGVTIRPVAAAQILGEVIVMSLLGAVLPVARIMRVDPMMVFRG
jgi:putative ABC transport system permease protein